MSEMVDRYTNEETGITYRREGDFYIPEIEMPTNDQKIGKFGLMYEKLLREYRYPEYIRMFILGEGDLTELLLKIDNESVNRMDEIMNEMLKEKNIAPSQMGTIEFSQMLESMRHQAEEIIREEMINSFKKTNILHLQD